MRHRSSIAVVGIGAVAVLASQIALVAIAPGLTLEAAKSFRVVTPLMALLSLPTIAALALTRRVVSMAMPFALPIMMVLGAAIRVIWFGAAAPREDDFFRYLWDGGLVAHGINPYMLAPQDIIDGLKNGGLPANVQDLAGAAKPVLTSINNPLLRTIYPGTAQIAFGLAHVLAPWSLDGLRLVFFFAETATAFLLIGLLRTLGRSPLWVGLYWCNPFVAVMMIGAAHVDVLIAPFVLGAVLLHMRGYVAIPLGLIGLAAGVKVWPVLLAPLFLRTVYMAPARLLAGLAALSFTAGATLLPLLLTSLDPRSGLQAYALVWTSNNALFVWAFDGLAALAGPAAAQGILRVLSAALAGAVAIVVALRRPASPEDFGRKALLVAATAFYCAPAQYPWYACWFLPLAALYGFWPLMAVSALLPLYYVWFPLFATPEFPLFSHGVALIHAVPILTWLVWRMASNTGKTEQLQKAARPA